MNIRSITVFIQPEGLQDLNGIVQAGNFVDAARKAYEAAGYRVQTVRLALTPFSLIIGAAAPAKIISFAQQVERDAAAAGFGYISLGPALPDQPGHYRVIPDALAATQSIFFSGLMTQPGGVISLEAVRLCAEVIHRAAPLSPDGFANLRFAALANVPAESPFFPAAYHRGGSPVFALALEAGILAVEAFTGADSLDRACQEFTRRVEEHAIKLGQVGRELQAQYASQFEGMDFSLAPFPERNASLGEALERLGVPGVGLHGTLAAAALVASTLDQIQFPRAGFNGLFFPVLEDAVLAERAADGLLSVKDLLLYSAVCGTGLDTVPLPGDTSVGCLEAALLDVAALAQRLGKPLTARLMPIPGKIAGDPTAFDFSFFANSRVMSLEAQPLKGALASGSNLRITPRR